MLTLGHVTNYATLCEGVKNGHTAIVRVLRKDGTAAVVVCVVSRKHSKDPGIYLPMAELNENGVDAYDTFMPAEGEVTTVRQEDIAGYAKTQYIPTKKSDPAATETDGPGVSESLGEEVVPVGED